MRSDPVEARTASGQLSVAALGEALPGLPRDESGPVFKAPWEAQAFAMTLALHERGVFAWKEWADTLAEVIAEVKARGEADTGENYYRHWLVALERIATRKQIVTGASLARRRDEWDDAARHTPHGKPIELPRSDRRE